jgi:hypothetical protein
VHFPDAPSRPDGPAGNSFRLPSWLLVLGCTLVGALAVILLNRLLRPVAAKGEGERAGQATLSSALANTDRMRLYWNLAPHDNAAPAMELPDVETGRLVSLTGLRGRPVVLLFGSFTCDLFCKQARDLETMYQRFKDRAAFLFVYVAEPEHKIPELEAVFAGVDPGPAGRRERALRGRKAFGMTIPTVLDSGDMPVMTAYEASPKRLVCVDKNGRIAFDAGRGLPEMWDLEAFERYLDEWLD